MYIRNLKFANFVIYFWNTILDASFTFYLLKSGAFPDWMDIPLIVIVAICIIVTWIDYIDNVTRKENKNETLD